MKKIIMMLVLVTIMMGCGKMKYYDFDYEEYGRVYFTENESGINGVMIYNNNNNFNSVVREELLETIRFNYYQIGTTNGGRDQVLRDAVSGDGGMIINDANKVLVIRCIPNGDVSEAMKNIVDGYINKEFLK